MSTKFKSYITAQAHARMLGYKYTAIDENKKIYGYTAKPFISIRMWLRRQDDYKPISCIGVNTDKINWKESLREL